MLGSDSECGARDCGVPMAPTNPKSVTGSDRGVLGSTLHAWRWGRILVAGLWCSKLWGKGGVRCGGCVGCLCRELCVAMAR